MNIHTKEDALVLKNLGYSRVVVSREAPLSVIKEIKDMGIEVEVFVHGALCVSYSGNCYFSSIVGKRSGNRGRCAQPCRMEYQLEVNSKVLDKGYLLSPKELCTIEMIDEYKRAHVDSLKIEGRLKRKEYVAEAVLSYAKAINKKNFILNKEMKNLKIAYNRGFTKGFIFNENNNYFTNTSYQNHQGILVGNVVSTYKDKVNIKLTDEVSFGDSLRIVGKKTDGVTINQMYLGSKLVKSAKAGDVVTIKVHEADLGKVILFALQQLLSILAGTITLPLIVGNGLSPSAALLGAGVGTFVYLVLTKFKSPIFLGSSFTFIGSMTSAFAGAASMSIGYFGILIGAFLAGLVYVILSIVIKHVGIGWINKVMPPVVIGPTVAIIGLTLAPNAVNSLLRGSVMVDGVSVANKYLCLLCGAVTLTVVILCSIYGKKMIKLIPFIIGILAGYLVAMIFTIIGNVNNIDALKIIDFSVFSNIKWVPDFALIHAIKGINDFSSSADFFKYLALIVVLYVPVAFVSFAEHIADHKNLSQIIDTNLIEDPGLHRTLLGDGIGSAVGSILGGCPNTTYGELKV